VCLGALLLPLAASDIPASDIEPARTFEPNYRIEIIGENGTSHAFSVARVTDRAGHARGLMHVPYLAPDTGMLFVFATAAQSRLLDAEHAHSPRYDFHWRRRAHCQHCDAP
jgi:hypothetical protein